MTWLTIGYSSMTYYTFSPQNNYIMQSFVKILLVGLLCPLLALAQMVKSV